MRWYMGAREPKRRTTPEWKERREFVHARLRQAVTEAEAYTPPEGSSAWLAARSGSADLAAEVAAMARRRSRVVRAIALRGRAGIGARHR